MPIFTDIGNEIVRSVALICATIIVSARDLRAAEYNATDVVKAAQYFETYLNGKMEPHA